MNYDDWKLDTPPHYETTDELTDIQKRDVIITDLSKKIMQLEKELQVYITAIKSDFGEITGVEIEEM